MGVPVNPAEHLASGELYQTRPGTPMIGPYSDNQMDDFYAALSRGDGA